MRRKKVEKMSPSLVYIRDLPIPSYHMYTCSYRMVLNEFMNECAFDSTLNRFDL